LKLIERLLSILHVVALRLWNQRGMMACSAAGLVAAVALSVGIPLYADATYHRMLHERVEMETGERHPPFSFQIAYSGGRFGLKEWEEIAPLDAYMGQQAAGVVRLPLKQQIRLLQTDPLRLYPRIGADYSNERAALAWLRLATLSDLPKHIQLLEGALPTPPAAPGQTLEVLISLPLAEELGLQVGEEYILYAPRKDTGMTEGVQQPIRIAGVWWPGNPEDPYWAFRSYQVLRDKLLTSEESFVAGFAPSVEGEIGYAGWYLEFDGQQVRAEEVAPLLGRIRLLQNRITGLLPNASIVQSPADALSRYRREALSLAILLYMFGIPLFGLVFYFIALVSGMIVSRQRNELAVLRSRGTTIGQIIGIYALEGAGIGLLALAVGALAAHGVAHWMGHTTSFLTFGSGAQFSTHLGWNSLRFGLIAVVASLLTSVGPAIRAARHTIVTYKQEQARTLQKPLWQRAYLDLLLLTPALYGYYVLNKRGTISILGDSTVTDSPFGNPLLFLIPTLFIFALSLLFIRLLPAVMRLLAWFGESGRGVVPVLALRHLARSPSTYTGPLLLLVLTLSLAVFTASMASTLNAHLLDQAGYEAGGDIRLVEMGENTRQTSTHAPGQSNDQGAAQENRNQTTEEQLPGPTWRFLPVDDHLLIPGVRVATRVGVYSMSELASRQRLAVIGVDRATLPLVAHFRPDYADQPLAALMNGLALNRDGLLVDRRVMAEQGWQVGDTIRAKLSLGDHPEVVFEIVGALNYFPTIYPEDGPFAVANLTYLHEQAGETYPYEVWLAVDDEVRAEQVADAARELGFRVVKVVEPRSQIERVQREPARQGVYGLLSVGFLAATFLTMLGYLIYSYVSFQRRFIQLGVLRAIGLSVRQMGGFLALEQLAVIAAGLVGGTLLGVSTTRLFIPFLQVQTGEHPLTPPFIVQIAWSDVAIVYVVFGIVLVGAVTILRVLLRRMNLFRAVKMGEVA